MSEIVLNKPSSPGVSRSCTAEMNSPAERRPSQGAVLTGGWDKPYALGIGCALDDQNIALDFIGSDEVDGPELRNRAGLRFLNLKGDQSPKARRRRKVLRMIRYYWRLIIYASSAEPKIFHLLWNNKFELFDRTVLMAYYRLLRKKVVFTAHNVNTAKRDAADSFINRVSLKIQYGLCHRIFVHTRKMKEEMVRAFAL